MVRGGVAELPPLGAWTPHGGRGTTSPKVPLAGRARPPAHQRERRPAPAGPPPPPSFIAWISYG